MDCGRVSSVMREVTVGTISVGSCFGIVRSIAAGSGPAWALAGAEAKAPMPHAAKTPKLNSRIEISHPVTLHEIRSPFCNRVLIKKSQANQWTW